ncbi:transposase [Ruminococcus sp.]|uniref:IS66 family transposase n=1 Tax=Ruminococcus sp. TaxID=41978 RepID=UPI002CB273C5|nr:transposase [Ruminococcus sp.]HOH87276.1 transposase [Ruminococcus sp.]
MKAENKTPACIIKKGLPDASLVADIMQRKYQLGETLYRQEQYWKLRGIYLNRTSLANWVIAGAVWFETVIRRLKYHAMSEPVLNADETPTRVLKKTAGKPTKKKGQLWIVCTGAAASKKIALYAYHDSRSKAVAEKLLRGYTGVVQTDVMPWNLALPAYCRKMYSEIQQKEDCATEILNVFTRGEMIIIFLKY